MALIFVDGFDSYDVKADLDSKWDELGITQFEYGTTIGRFGGGGVRLLNDVLNIAKNFPEAGTTGTTDELIVSVSMKAEALPSGSADALFELLSVEGDSNLSLTITNAGAIEIRRGNAASTVLGTSASNVIKNQWQRLQLQCVMANSPNGSADVLVDGATVLSLSGIDTQASGAIPGAGRIELAGPNMGLTDPGWVIDDFIIHSTAGGAPTALLGDLEIQTLRPNAAGDSSDGTASPAVANYLNVDDPGMNDGDTTYVAMSTAADLDLYNISNLTGVPDTVHAVVVNTVCRADGSDPRTLKTKVKENVTEGDGATLVVPFGADYKTLQGYFATNPDTASAWTASEVDGMQIGQEIVV